MTDDNHADERSKQVERIRSQANTWTQRLPQKWVFVPISEVAVNDRECDCWIGELYYEHPGYQIGPAVRVKNWVFCREIATRPFWQYLLTLDLLPPGASPDPSWMLCAFRAGTGEHYTFRKDTSVGASEFFRSVVDQFFSILCEELFADGLVNPSPENLAKAARSAQFVLPNLGVLLDDSVVKKRQREAVQETGQPRLLFGGGDDPASTLARKRFDLSKLRF
jgi:hypothetical protein